MLNLSHCSSTDFIAIGGAVFSGMEDKPNPVGAVKMFIKQNENNKKKDKKKDKNE